MRNAPEVVREVGVHDFRMATKQQLLHLHGGLLGVAPSAVGVDFQWISVHSRCGPHTRAGHQFVTRYPKASDISSPPCLLRLLPAGAISPGGACTHWKSAALSRRTPFADLRRRCTT